jgi:phosphate transport system permease protein
MHIVWMTIGLIVVVLLPFILGIGLYIKSTLLLEDKEFGELLFSSDWRPLSSKFGFLTFAISSVWVTVLSLLIAGPICLLTAIHLTQYAKGWVLKIMHPVIDILAGIPSVIFGVWGIPSIVYGAFGFTIMIYFGLQTSLLAGIITVTLFIIPIMVRAKDEVLKTVPVGLLETSLSLGSTQSETAFKVFLRQASPGLVTAVLLSFGRAIGDAAGERKSILIKGSNIT